MRANWRWLLPFGVAVFVVSFALSFVITYAMWEGF